MFEAPVNLGACAEGLREHRAVDDAVRGNESVVPVIAPEQRLPCARDAFPEVSIGLTGEEARAGLLGFLEGLNEGRLHSSAVSIS